MGLAELEKKLRADGRKQAKAIEDEAATELEAVRERFKLKAEKRAKQVEAEGKKRAKLAAKKIEAAARLQAKKRLRDEKNKLLDAAFSAARKRALALPAEKKKKLADKFLEKRKLVKGEAVVVVDPKHAKLLDESGDYFIQEKKLGDFGLIIEARDGSLTVDMTAKTLLAQSKPALAPKAAKKLFGGSK